MDSRDPDNRYPVSRDLKSGKTGGKSVDVSAAGGRNWPHRNTHCESDSEVVAASEGGVECRGWNVAGSVAAGGVVGYDEGDAGGWGERAE